MVKSTEFHTPCFSETSDCATSSNCNNDAEDTSDRNICQINTSEQGIEHRANTSSDDRGNMTNLSTNADAEEAIGRSHSADQASKPCTKPAQSESESRTAESESRVEADSAQVTEVEVQRVESSVTIHTDNEAQRRPIQTQFVPIKMLQRPHLQTAGLSQLQLQKIPL